MKVCPYCKRQIIKGQEIIVLAFPLRCNSDRGEYSYLGDFLKHEYIYHFHCFKKLNVSFPQNLVSNQNSEIKENTVEIPFPPKPSVNRNLSIEQTLIVHKLYDILKDMGERIEFRDLDLFISKNNTISNMSSIGDLIKLWFQQRNKF